MASTSRTLACAAILRLLEDGSGGYVFTDDAQNAYTFDAEGRILSAADPQGNALLYSYDGDGRLARVADSLRRPLPGLQLRRSGANRSGRRSHWTQRALRL